MTYLPTTPQVIPGWELLITDRYGNQVARVESAVINEVVWQLNDVGKLDFTISPHDPAAPLIKSIATEVQLWYKGLPIWWGPLVTRRGSPTATNWIAEDPLTILKHRLILRSSEVYTSIDQVSIADQIVQNAQTGESYMDLNILIPSTQAASGVIRSRLYDRSQHADRLSLLQEFPGLTQGFDFSVVIDPSGSKRYFTCHYPQKGSAASVTTLAWGKNVVGYDYNEDGHGMANEVYATGASQGGVRFENNYEDPNTPQTYGVMQKVVSNSQVTDVGWLLAWAQRYASVYNAPPVSMNLYSVETDDTQLLGVVQTGDVVTVTIQNDDVNIVDQPYRISEIHWKPGSTSGPVELVFVPPLVSV